MIDQIRNDRYDPHKPLRVHEVEVVSEKTGRSTCYRGWKLRDSYARSIVRLLKSNSKTFRWTSTDNGIRFGTNLPSEVWYIYGAQRP